MTEDENFGVQRSAGPEQPGHNAPDQPAEIDHRIECHPIRPPRPAGLGLQ